MNTHADPVVYRTSSPVRHNSDTARKMADIHYNTARPVVAAETTPKPPKQRTWDMDVLMGRKPEAGDNMAETVTTSEVANTVTISAQISAKAARLEKQQEEGRKVMKRMEQAKS